MAAVKSLPAKSDISVLTKVALLPAFFFLCIGHIFLFLSMSHNFLLKTVLYIYVFII